jgi:hypothetical protein
MLQVFDISEPFIRLKCLKDTKLSFAGVRRVIDVIFAIKHDEFGNCIFVAIKATYSPIKQFTSLIRD